MATHRVRTPEPGVHDKVGSVNFHDGVADVDAELHEAELRYFRSAGYTVEELDAPAAEPDEYADVDGDGTVEALPRGNASLETWRAFAVEHGMAEVDANSMSRDQLAAHYKKEAGQ